MMTSRTIAATVGLAMLFWVVPSIGTQGMGTVGQQAVHPDAMLIDTADSHVRARVVLTAADSAAEAALGF